MLTLIAILALVFQPVYGLAVSQVVGAAPATLHGPVDVTVSGAAPYNSVPINAAGHTDTKLKFSYNAEELDNGDNFTYGYKILGAETSLGMINGLNETGVNASTDETGAVEIGVPANSALEIFARVSANTASDIVSITGLVVDGEVVAPPAPVCTYDFASQKMWEINWGTPFNDRNASPTFNTKSHGGLVGLNGGAVPSYINNYDSANPTKSWHWLYVTEGNNAHFNYNFADGTVRTVDVVFSNVNGCQLPTVTWGMYQANDNTFSVGGSVFNNKNSDRDRDNDEERLAGWDVRLYRQANASSAWDLQATSTTNSSGIYHFPMQQQAGTYYVCEVMKTGWTQTKQDWAGTPFHVATANNSPNKSSEGQWCAMSVYTDVADRGWQSQLGNIDTGKPTGTATYAGGILAGDVRYLSSINDLKYSVDLADNYSLKHTSYTVWKTDSNFTNGTKTLYCGNWNNATTSVNVSGTSDAVVGDVKDCLSGGSWADGHYLIMHVVYDQAGNLNYFGAPYPGQKFVVDSTAPALSDGLYDPVARTLTFSLSDDDVDNIELQVEGNTIIGVPNIDKTIWTFDVSAYDAPGMTYEYTATATDRVGNVSTTDRDIDGQTVLASFEIAPANTGGSNNSGGNANTPGANLSAVISASSPLITSSPATAPITTPASFNPVFNTDFAGTAGNTDGDVLGATSEDSENESPANKSAQASVLSAQDEKGNIFGIAWYWWLLIIAAVAAFGWWLLAALRRRKQEE